MIETTLQELTAAVKENTAAVNALIEKRPKVGRPAKEASETPDPGANPPVATTSAIDLPKLRELGMSLVKLKRQQEVKDLCKEFGAENLSSLEAKHYSTVAARLEALLKAPAEADVC